MKFSGATVRRLREEADLTRPALAELAGTSKSTIKRIETDVDSHPSIAVVEGLARALNVPITDLFTDRDTQEETAA